MRSPKMSKYFYEREEDWALRQAKASRAPEVFEPPLRLSPSNRARLYQLAVQQQAQQVRVDITVTNHPKKEDSL